MLIFLGNFPNQVNGKNFSGFFIMHVGYNNKSLFKAVFSTGVSKYVIENYGPLFFGPKITK